MGVKNGTHIEGGTYGEGVKEDRVLRRILDTMRDRVIEKWRKLHTEELNDLYLTKYYLDDQIEKKPARERRGEYRVLVGEPVGKKPPGRPKHRWEGNNKMDLQEVGWGAWT